MEEFPYKRYYTNASQFNKLVEKGLKFKPVYIQREQLPPTNPTQRHPYISPKDDPYFQFGILTIEDDPNYAFNDLTDYFTEPCRIRCLNEKASTTLLDYYKKNRIKLVKKLDKQKKPLTMRNLNQIIYKEIPHCTNYKISYLLGVLEYFKPKSWLDMSSGWGDRLISAILYSKRLHLQSLRDEVSIFYKGIDPNPCLHPYYKEIIESIGDRVSGFKAEMLQMGAEDFEPKEDEMYDLVYTSPPFFTFEKYQPSDVSPGNQSVSKFTTLEDWLTKFLFVTIDTSWDCLKEGGNYLLYIEDKPQYPFIDRVINYISNKGPNGPESHSTFKGYIYQIYRNNKYKSDTYRKILWFQKQKSL